MNPSEPPMQISEADERRILQARARTLAAEHPPAEDAGELLAMVEFELAGGKYAFELSRVCEVLRFTGLTPVPCTPAFVCGIINLRGQIRTVIDLQRFFELPDQNFTDLHRILVIHAADLQLGILADAIRGVRRIHEADLQSPSADRKEHGAHYLRGITRDGVALLDAVKILSDARIVVHDET